MPRSVIGSDLARGRIDTHALPSGAAARIVNTSRDVARWAASLPKDTLVVFEGEAGDGPVRWTDPPPNSGCDGHPIDVLAERRIPFARVNPRQARESGTRRGTRRIRGGRRKVREALCIAALSASRRIPVPKAMRERIREAGKAPGTILIAVARKLLVILNAMIRNQQPLRT